MKRYLKLYALLLRLGLVSLLTYRVNFINNVLSSILFSSLTILAMMLLTSRTSSVFGWTRYELWLLTAVYNVVFGIVYILFASNFDELVKIINKGELDSWLLKPIDTQFSISVWKVAYANLFRCIIASCYIFFLLSLLYIAPTLITLLNFVICILFSILLIYSASFLIMTLAIWFSTLTNLMELIYYMNGLTRYPREMYRGVGNLVFFILFPLTLVVVVPTRTLLGKASFMEYSLLFVCSITLFFLSRKFWKFALRFYTSASG
ncbi:MAG TPA: ABC-2 family transporter protein [Candidatus Saccharimonadales bacterium]|nr:ABC-2 family transporter protein [Candidatus Saccharimonadales bacterium]